MTRKCQNHRSQTNPWYCEEDTQKTDTHTQHQENKTTQAKARQPVPLPHQDDCKTRRTPRTTLQNKTQRTQQQTFKRGSREKETGDHLPSSGKLHLKAIGFLSNTGPDPLENHKATNPAINDGSLSARQRNAI